MFCLVNVIWDQFSDNAMFVWLISHQPAVLSKIMLSV
jgi:hypothetical protein